jgi:hypothetical protein
MAGQWPHDIGLLLGSCDPGDALAVHHLGDVAATVARVVFETGDLYGAGDACDTALSGWLRDRVPGAAALPPAALTFDGAVLAAEEEGARLGFALALTLSKSGEGWPAWGRPRWRCAPGPGACRTAAPRGGSESCGPSRRRSSRPDRPRPRGTGRAAVPYRRPPCTSGRERVSHRVSLVRGAAAAAALCSGRRARLGDGRGYRAERAPPCPASPLSCSPRPSW